jgi:hypothetical protein
MKIKAVILSIILLAPVLISNSANGSATYAYASYFDWQGAKLASNSSMSQTITPLEISPSTYWEEGWRWENGPDGGYGGIQSQGILANGQLSDLAIFSVWDAIQAIPGDANAGCVVFGGEGKGYSCRVPIDLVVGHSYRMTFGVDQNRGSDWWEATVEDLMSGKTQDLGSIQTSQANLYAANWNNFIEYWGPDIPCDSVGPGTAKFSNPVASNASIGVKFWKFSKPTNQCGFTSADIPRTGDKGDPVMHFGGPIQLADTVYPPMPSPRQSPAQQKKKVALPKNLQWSCFKGKAILKIKGQKIACPLGYKLKK